MAHFSPLERPETISAMGLHPWPHTGGVPQAPQKCVLYGMPQERACNGFFLLVRYNKPMMVPFGHIEGSQVVLSKNCISFLANKFRPTEIPYYAAFHLCLHCLPKVRIKETLVYKGSIPFIAINSQQMYFWGRNSKGFAQFLA